MFVKTESFNSAFGFDLKMLYPLTSPDDFFRWFHPWYIIYNSYVSVHFIRFAFCVGFIYEFCLLISSVDFSRWFFLLILPVDFIRRFYPLILSRRTWWTWRGLRLSLGSLSSRLAQINQRSSLAWVVHTTLFVNVRTVFVVVAGNSNSRYSCRAIQMPWQSAWHHMMRCCRRFTPLLLVCSYGDKTEKRPATRSLRSGFVRHCICRTDTSCTDRSFRSLPAALRCCAGYVYVQVQPRQHVLQWIMQVTPLSHGNVS